MLLCLIEEIVKLTSSQRQSMNYEMCYLATKFQIILQQFNATYRVRNNFLSFNTEYREKQTYLFII